MKLKTIIIVIFFLGILYLLKNYKSIYDTQQSEISRPEGKLLNGKKEGKWITKYQSGKVQTIENYKNDTLNGDFFFYMPDGKIRTKGSYKNGVKVDSLIFYFSNGKINSEEWKDDYGKSQGSFKIYHENGKLSQIGKFLNGKLIDTSKTYTENGILKETKVNGNINLDTTKND